MGPPLTPGWLSRRARFDVTRSVICNDAAVSERPESGAETSAQRDWKAEAFVDRLVVKDLSRTSIGFDHEDLEFIRANPEVVDKLGDTEVFKRKYVFVLFAVAFFVASTAKVIEYTEVLSHHPVAEDLATNVAFSVAMELMGAALVAYVMELVLARRLQRNRELVSQLRLGGPADAALGGAHSDPSPGPAEG